MSDFFLLADSIMRSEDETSAFLSKPQLYGGFGGVSQDGRLALSGKAQALYARSQRQRLNVVPVFQCLLLPWLFFCVIHAVMCFHWHYAQRPVCFAVVGAGLVLVLVLGGVAVYSGVRKARSARAGEPMKPPSWLIFFAVTSLAAWVLAVVLGDLNFWTNMQPYYDYANLNEHWRVDPSQIQGQELMDAGRIHFTNNTVVDVQRSMGFRNLDMYCVAPITVKAPEGTLKPLETYDFWAVGLDCCSANSADFHCGEFANPNAHQGLRLLRDEQRPFFRLAIQQAEAAHSIKATHPLFFYWTADATSEMESFRMDGYRYFLVGMLAHFAWQLLCVGLAFAGFLKLGHA